MAWWCSGSTNDELVENMVKKKVIRSPGVAAVMKSVDRRHYTRGGGGDYKDSPQPIGHGVTISAPHMHAIALQLVEGYMRGKHNSKVLDVGSGSGYLTACLAKMASGEEARVYGVDHVPELVEWATSNVTADSPELLNSRLSFIVGDGRLGLPDQAPFDVIHVGAAAPELPPALVDQLAVGGRLVIPIGTRWGDQYLEVVDKVTQAEVVRNRAMPVKFVPLTDRDRQV